MTKHLLFLFASLFLVAGTVHAQSASLRADIPFEFVVGNTIMPAGAYTIQPSNLDGSMVELWSPDIKNGILLMVCTCASDRNPEQQHESKLVFQVSNGQYFLWQIWTEGYDAGRQLTIKHPRTQEAKLAPPRTFVVAAAIGKA
jgi:hypothetical protein